MTEPSLSHSRLNNFEGGQITSKIIFRVTEQLSKAMEVIRPLP
jgi:hypothetical protein